MIDYFKWIGLPHKFGADPDDGEGADCLILAHKILVSAGAPCPPLRDEWLELAGEKKWDLLEREWNEHMEETSEPRQFDLHMVRNPETGFSIATVVGDGVVFVSHRKGVAWIPLGLVQGNFWRVRCASS
jgi:hypothetical protein